MTDWASDFLSMGAIMLAMGVCMCLCLVRYEASAERSFSDLLQIYVFAALLLFVALAHPCLNEPEIVVGKKKKC